MDSGKMLDILVRLEDINADYSALLDDIVESVVIKNKSEYKPVLEDILLAGRLLNRQKRLLSLLIKKFVGGEGG